MPPPSPSKNNTGIIIGVVIGVIAVGLLIAITAGGGDSQPKEVTKDEPIRKPDAGVTPIIKNNPPKEDRKQKREEKAKEVFEQLKDFASKNIGKPHEIVNKCMELMADIDGTSYADAAAAILRKARDEQYAIKAAKQVDDILIAVRKLYEGETDFMERREIESKLNEATRLAENYAKHKIEAVKEEREGYRKALEKAAVAKADAVIRRADEFLKNQRYTQAMEALEGFPTEFEDTTAYEKIEAKKREVSGKLAELRRIPNIYQDFRRATAIMTRNNDYQGGYDLYMKVLDRMKNRALVRLQRMSQREATAIRTIGNYNVACYYSKERSDADKACEYLEGAIEAGYREWEHMDQDTDLDNIRNSKKYKALLKKYRE